MPSAIFLVLLGGLTVPGSLTKSTCKDAYEFIQIKVDSRSVSTKRGRVEARVVQNSSRAIGFIEKSHANISTALKHYESSELAKKRIDSPLAPEPSGSLSFLGDIRVNARRHLRLFAFVACILAPVLAIMFAILLTMCLNAFLLRPALGNAGVEQNTPLASLLANKDKSKLTASFSAESQALDKLASKSPQKSLQHKGLTESERHSLPPQHSLPPISETDFFGYEVPVREPFTHTSHPSVRFLDEQHLTDRFHPSGHECIPNDPAELGTTPFVPQESYYARLERAETHAKHLRAELSQDLPLNERTSLLKQFQEVTAVRAQLLSDLEVAAALTARVHDDAV